MAITKGIRLNKINKNDIKKVDYSDQGNLIILTEGTSEWLFVYDNNGKKISKEKLTGIFEEQSKPHLLNFSIGHVASEAVAGNDDILTYLLDGVRGK